MDCFAPLGPAVVTADEVGDPHNLNISCRVNNEIKQVRIIIIIQGFQSPLHLQSSNTSNLVFDISYIVSWVSQFTTLLPGDIILTGTPSGVGANMRPQQFLQRGDVVECNVENIGSVINRII